MRTAAYRVKGASDFMCTCALALPLFMFLAAVLSYTILFCFLFFCRNLTSIKKEMCLSEKVAFRKLFLLRIV